MDSFYGRFPVKFVAIDEASSGASAQIAAVTGKRIRVMSFFMVAAGAVGVKFQSATTDLTGVMSLAANGGISTTSHSGLFETAAGEALNINLSAAVQVSGSMAYVELD